MTNHTADPDQIVDAVTLMIRALRQAADDAGPRDLLKRIDRIVVNQGQWRWPDPARLVGDAVGADSATSVLAMACGSTPQGLVHDAAPRIISGDAQLVAVCGGEWVHGRHRLRTLGHPLPVTVQTAGRPDDHFGHNRQWESDVEMARGFSQPLNIYGLFENALRQRLGEDVEANRAAVATMMARLSEVAARHPDSWNPVAYRPDEIRDPGPGNRMVVFAYTKRMCSNCDVDMASAILVTSVELAESLGVPESQWVYPLGGADCDDPCFFSELERIDDSPALRATVRAAYAHLVGSRRDRRVRPLLVLPRRGADRGGGGRHRPPPSAHRHGRHGLLRRTDGAVDFEGTAAVESATVLFGRDPERAIMTGLVDDGSRVLAWSTDPGLVDVAISDAWPGMAVDLASDGCIRRLH